MRLVIYGKDQLWKTWYFISLKRIFVTGFNYKTSLLSLQPTVEEIKILEELAPF